jgi:hypothetical protein
MERARDELLPRSRFARDKDREVGTGELADLCEQVSHPLGSTDQVAA